MRITFLEGNDRPLLLVGEQSRVGNFRPHLKYDFALEKSIDGNFEKFTPQELHNQVIETIQNYQTNKRKELIGQLLSSPPKLVVIGNQEIAEAAKAGRIERMYTPIYKRTSDSVRPGESEVIILQLPSNIDELESVVRSVLLQSATVLAVEIDAYPAITEAKALCRY